MFAKTYRKIIFTKGTLKACRDFTTHNERAKRICVTE